MTDTNVYKINIFQILRVMHCTKSVRIRSYSGPHFPAFGLNTERFSVSLRIQSECGKIWTRKTPNTGTFYAVLQIWNIGRKWVNSIQQTLECIMWNLKKLNRELKGITCSLQYHKIKKTKETQEGRRGFEDQVKQRQLVINLDS